MLAKRFFFVSLGILALMIAYHWGAARTEAQPGGEIVQVVTYPYGGTNEVFLILSNGDVWHRRNFAPSEQTHYPWNFGGNVFSGGPTPTKSTSWGEVKVRDGQ